MTHDETLNLIAHLEEAFPRMTSDGYEVSKALVVTFFETGELGKGVHGRYRPNIRDIQFAGDIKRDTVLHEYAHAMLDAGFHQCPRLRKTAGHCSHFDAQLKILSKYA